MINSSDPTLFRTPVQYTDAGAYRSDCSECPPTGLLRCVHFEGRSIGLYRIGVGGQWIDMWHVCHPPCAPTPQDSFYDTEAAALAAFHEAEARLLAERCPPCLRKTERADAYLARTRPRKRLLVLEGCVCLRCGHDCHQPGRCTTDAEDASGESCGCGAGVRHALAGGAE